MKYRLVFVVDLECSDDVEARKAAHTTLRISGMKLAASSVKLQKVFPDKPPRGVPLGENAETEPYIWGVHYQLWDNPANTRAFTPEEAEKNVRLIRGVSDSQALYPHLMFCGCRQVNKTCAMWEGHRTANLFEQETTGEPS